MTETQVTRWGLGLAYAVDSQNHLQVYHTDGLGSVRAITDGTGSITTTYQTDAFGNPTATVGALGQPFAFTGQEQDLNNLVYLHTRYYDPMTGRFLSRDPFFGFLGDPLSLNRYTYTENNPVSAVDPSGMSSSQVLADPVVIWTSADEGVNVTPLSPQTNVFLGGLMLGGVNVTIQHLVDAVVSIFTPAPPDSGVVSATPSLGDLTPEEVQQIQSIVDEVQRPLTVVSSATEEGGRRFPGSARQIGKKEWEKSDIDYVTNLHSVPYFAGVQNRLPEIDRHGVLPEGREYSGPRIRFEPGQEPVFIPGS